MVPLGSSLLVKFSNMVTVPAYGAPSVDTMKVVSQPTQYSLSVSMMRNSSAQMPRKRASLAAVMSRAGLEGAVETSMPGQKRSSLTLPSSSQ